MNINRNFLRRPLAIVSAMALTLGVASPALLSTVANAGQASSRSVQLSNSTPSATGVTYNISFKATSAATVGGIIIDFCSDTPIVGNTTCAYPAGFNVGGATPTVSGLSGFSTNTGWTAAGQQGGGASASVTQTLRYYPASPTAPSAFSTTPINFQITGVTNPSTTGSFYARILTFDTSANASAYTTTEGTTTTRPASPITGMLDYGGAAMSTASQVSITATVQETMTFCVSANTITGTCSGLATPNLTIGTGTPAVLTTAGQSTPAYTQITTNASGGSIVRMKATNACTNGGLSTSAPDVAGGCASIAGNGATAAVLAGGQFGMCVAPGAGITAATNYLDNSVNNCPTTFNATAKYGMNGTNLTSTYGDQIYSAASAVNAISSTLNFAAMAANTTPAGVYQGNEILIATGTF